MSPDRDPEKANGWNEWSRHVLACLAENKEDHKALFSKLEDIKIDLATTKTELRLKAGFWGLLAGALPSAIAIVWFLMQRSN